MSLRHDHSIGRKAFYLVISSLILAVLLFVPGLSTFSSIGYCGALAAEGPVLKGKVSDAEGRPVEGALVFIYNGPSVRRSADFMSTPSDKEGLYRAVLPPGRYWAVARSKKSGAFGPLMPGDRHSGEPAEIEISAGAEAHMDFTVTDIREAMKIRTKTTEGPARVSGRIIDEDGTPVLDAYALAGKSEKVTGIPEYLSAWTDHDGRYTIYLPRGRYYLGGSVVYPPGDAYFMRGEITIDGDKDGLDIVRKSR